MGLLESAQRAHEIDLARSTRTNNVRGTYFDRYHSDANTSTPAASASGGPPANYDQVVHYEPDGTGYWRRKASAPLRPANLPPKVSRLVPDIEEHEHSFPAERGDMNRLRKKRAERREGNRNVPMKDVLSNELAIQHRAREALQTLVEHETTIIATLDALIRDASLEAAAFTEDRDTAEVHLRR